MRHTLLLLVILLWTGTTWAQQETVVVADSVLIMADSIPLAHHTVAPDSTVRAVMRGADSAAAVTAEAAKKQKKEFKPNPSTATLMALVPGLGQIYNRKYWKLPIVYGGFMGCLYAITWNSGHYSDYSLAYQDILTDYNNGKTRPEGEWHQSWQDLLNGRSAKEYVNNTQFHNQLKNRKDYFRRNRDLSIIITVGIYLLSIADAYIDAQLFDFDISPDLSLHLEPSVSPRTSFGPQVYGLNCSLTF